MQDKEPGEDRQQDNNQSAYSPLEWETILKDYNRLSVKVLIQFSNKTILQIHE